MKKLLLTFSLAAMLLGAKAQIIITGVMADPGGGSGADASATDANNKGYEYAQFRATQTINFETDPYSVVFLYETTTTVLPNDGWASGKLSTAAQQALTYQFNLTSGIVQKGDFFYVGGDGKLINGSGSTDISGAKWIRVIDYAKTSGDSGHGTTRTALLGNSIRANAVAVFSGIIVAENMTPIDAVFYGQLGANHYDSNLPTQGFRVPNNGVYTTADEFYGKGSNTFTAASAYLTANANLTNAFIKFGGDYNTTTNTWDTPRSGTRVVLTPTSTLADIESGAGTTTLPVSLTSFTAKATKQGTVNLNWATASEQNNSHFEVNRSIDATNFTKIGEVAGNGTTNTAKNYNYIDNNPAAGVNYYQLKQVDNDGKSALSGVVPVKVGLGQNDLKASAAANRASITVNYNGAASGKATFTVYNVSGAKLATVQQSVNAGSNQLNIPVQLGNSLHLLKVEQGGESVSVKF